VTLAERAPTVDEYAALVASVGFRARDRDAIARAMANSYHAVCAVVDGVVVGCGRVIGDGGLHYYLTDVLVHPDHQRKGIGTEIVAALTSWIEALPYKNTVVGVMPTRGQADFYARHGYRIQQADSPAMARWINRSDD